MRHFAAELAADGDRVDFWRLDDRGNAGRFRDELMLAI